MATTSTAPAVIDAVLAAVNTDLPGTVTAFESWPGPDAAPEMVVFGEIAWEAYDVASIKAGRQQRQETFTIGFEVFVFGTAGTTPAITKPVRDRAFVLATSLEDVLAEDPDLGTGPGGWVETRLTGAGPRVFEKGWAYRVAGNIHVNARLT
jgi:hypothetical protein